MVAATDYKIKFFGRRKGKKIRPGRASLLDDLLPKLAIKTPESGEKISPPLLFPFTPKEVWLEVGFGGGEHLAEQARRNPDIGIIGAEVFINGVASLLAHLTNSHQDGADGAPVISQDRTDNVRIYNDDVRLLFEALPDACFSRIFVLFPDPWPKKRHEGRRFIGPSNLPTLARLLKKGGELRVASDDMTYIRWSLEHLTSSPLFAWTAKDASDWTNPPANWVNTRYEQKAIKAGRKPVYLSFKRV